MAAQESTLCFRSHNRPAGGSERKQNGLSALRCGRSAFASMFTFAQRRIAFGCYAGSWPPLSGGGSMITVQKRCTTVVDPRLSVLFHETANFRLQLYELSKLRYRVRQAELSARNRARSH